MKIIIPSRHIYQRENKKMIDNAIANVSFNENIYNRNIIEMYSNANASNSSTQVQAKTYIGAWGTGGEAKRVRFELECSFHKYNFSATAREAIRDDEIQLLSHITTSGNTQGENFTNYEYLIKNKEPDYTIENIPFPIPASTNYTEISQFCMDLIEEKLGFVLSSVSDYNVSVILTYLKSIKVYLTQETLFNGVWGNTTRTAIGVSPTITGLSLSLFLNYSKVTATAKTIGSTGLTHALEKNELLQVGTLINGEKASNYLATQILRGYKNGKETATLLCGINDYYDENGNKVISTETERMSFRMYDEVIPMVRTADGIDTPMSKRKDGSTKSFIVVGSNIFYDGAVFQELSLQEA